MKTRIDIVITVVVNHDKKMPEDYVVSTALDSIHFSHPVGCHVEYGCYDVKEKSRKVLTK